MLDLAGKKLVVFGFSPRTGVSAARFALKKGARVIAVDKKPKDAHTAALAELGQDMPPEFLRNFELIAGEQPARALDNAALMILSPGVPRTGELCDEAARRGIPVIGDIELAWHFAHCRIAGITGTDGKSTVVSMVGSILAQQSRGCIAGNIGIPVLNVVEEIPQDQILALELSSFMLESIDEFSPELGAILNFGADHLDRYPDMESYLQAKLRLFTHLARGAKAVYPLDSAYTGRFASAVPDGVTHIPFGAGGAVHLSRGSADQADSRAWIMRQDTPIMPLSELRVFGQHNSTNALAAAAISHALGIPDAEIRAGLADFSGLPHRYEYAGVVSGVRFINDSKATTVSAVMSAAESAGAGASILLGGRDKGLDFTPLAASIRAKGLKVFPFGEAGAKIRAQLAAALGSDAALSPVEARLESAIKRAYASALDRKAGEVVLSPGCTSFDEFDNFEVRGDFFRDWVRKQGAEAKGG
ncbi:MAG: UDP-N-acetylmuramoyl-L-alanine--D-glutamate ligase [Spirochaetota bacterium]|nr:UDP-N-acetylmuramoyl-L-alanine--D-glutamate ligase [Spirochaetota bacterium]